MSSTQQLIDSIFGPKLKIVEKGAKQVAKGNPAREALLQRIETIRPDSSFERERKIARMSFAFTERERTLFTHKFLELAAMETRPQGVGKHLMTRSEFVKCWTSARTFEPSNEVVDTIEELFDVPSQHPDFRIDCVDFTRACALDTEESDSVPFAVSFTKEERRRYDGVVEFLYYIPFLVLFSFILVSLRQLPTAFQVHQAVADNIFDRRFLEPCSGNLCNEQAQRVITFRGITEKAYFYEWLRTQVTPTLWAGTPSDDGDKRVNERLIGIGALRIQQYRVDAVSSDRQYDQLFADTNPTPNETAKINDYYSKNLSAFTRYPAGPAATDGDDDAPGGGWSKAPFNQAAVAAAAPPLYIQNGFKYTPVLECGSYVRGFLRNYLCSGHIVDLPLNLTKNDTLDAINRLEKLDWIDAGTRFVAIRAIFFNKDYQVFGRFVGGFEVPPGGFWMSVLRSNLFRFFTLPQQSIAWIFFFIVFLAWLAWNILQFAVDVTDQVRASARALGRPFASAFDAGFGVGFLRFVAVLLPRSLWKVTMKDPWIFVDGGNYAIFVIVWFWRAKTWTKYDGFDTWNNQFYPNDIEAYSNINADIDYLESVNIILSYVRLLKTLRVFPVLRLIFKSLATASFDLFGMAFTALVLIVAFALSGFVAYGALLPDFSTVPNSLITILRFVVGDYDYDGWESSRSIMSPFFFAMLQILLVVVVLEFITAIIADTFGDLSKLQYRADYIKHVIEADLRNVLTADVVDSPARSPIVMELVGFFKTLRSYMLSWYRFFESYLCAQNEDEMTEDEKKQLRHRTTYENPPVDSALYIINQATLKPQKLHYAIETLMERSYIEGDDAAAEALFLLYEMMFELESRESIRKSTTRQLVFTLASSHCNTQNLTKHLETTPKNLVSALINRLGMHNYPFLVAVGIHIPHAVAHLPRVARFVSMFEAHSGWLSAVRNESLARHENQVALNKLQKVVDIAETIAEDQWSLASPRGVPTTTTTNNNNNNIGHGPKTVDKTVVSTTTAAAAADAAGPTSPVVGQEQKQKQDVAKPSPKSKNNSYKTTQEHQEAVDATEALIRDDLRTSALFCGMDRAIVDQLFHDWDNEQLVTPVEKLGRIAALRAQWEQERRSWIEAGVADTVDLDEEAALLFGGERNHQDQQQASQEMTEDPRAKFDAIRFFDKVYHSSALTHIRDDCARKTFTQGWTERKRKQFRKLVLMYFENKLEQQHEEQQRQQQQQQRQQGKRQINQEKHEAAQPSAGTAFNSTSSHPLAAASSSIYLNASASQRILHHRPISLKVFSAIWKKIVGAAISDDFKQQLTELSVMTVGKAGLDSSSSSTSNSNNDQQAGNGNDNNNSDHNNSNNNNNNNKSESEDSLSKVAVDAHRFQQYCVVVPEAHSLVSISSHHFKIQHEMLFNTVQLLLYIPFIVFFTLLLVLAQNDLGTYSSVTVREYIGRAFKSPYMRPFEQISNTDQWRNWISQNVFGQFLPEVAGKPHLSFTGHSFAVGGIRIRQLRIKAVSDCGFPDPGALPADTSSPFYQERKRIHFPTFCVPRWAVGFQETSDMLKNTSGLSADATAAFRFQSDPLCLAQQEGFSGYYSSCDGYSLFVPASTSRVAASNLLDEVMPLWIDASTRALIVDFFAYNYNDNIFVRTLVLGETSAGGGWKFQIKQDPFRLFTFSPIGTQSLAWIIVMSFFIFFYFVIFAVFVKSTIGRIRFVRRRLSCSWRNAFWTATTESFWWWIELLTYLLIFGSLATRFYFMSAPSDVVRVYRDEYPARLVSYAESAWALILIDAINTFFVYIRIFYFVRLNNDFNILPKTIVKAADYMISILVISVIVMIAFALAGHVVYGATVFSMSSVAKALRTLALTIFGHGDFEAWLYDKPVWTVVYYALFTFVGVQILFNMITSVLARAYSNAKDERFDTSELGHVRSVDSTILGRPDLFHSFFDILVEEVRYRVFLVVRWFQRTCTSKRSVNHTSHQDALRNPYTFYRFMDEATALLEQGSPKQGAVAAGNLLVTMDLLRDAHRDNADLQRRWNAAIAASPSANLTVFGVDRPTLMNYTAEQVPDAQFGTIFYWCVKAPMQFLGLGPAVAIQHLLESHQTWVLSAKKYLKLDDDGAAREGDVEQAEERDEKLGAVVGRLTRATEKVIRHYK